MRYICTIGIEIGAEKGDLTEWSIVVVWKTIEVQASVGSNPTVSAFFLVRVGRIEFILCRL